MSLDKQAVNINFSQGLDQKSDNKQVQVGKFLKLRNTVFNKGGKLQKRNGFAKLTQLPDTTYTGITTFNNNLTAIGPSISAYNAGSATWSTKGTIQPLSLKTLPIVKNSIHQTQCDAVVASNNLVCTVYTEVNASSTSYKYVIADSLTGQNIIAPTAIPVASGTVVGSPRVFLVGNYFVIVFTNVITATSHLQYIAISTANPSVKTTAADIASAYISATTLSWDAVTVGTSLYVAYNTTSGGQAIKVTYLNATQIATGGSPASPVTFAAEKAEMVSMCADTTSATPIIYVTYWTATGTLFKTLAVDTNLATILSATTISNALTLANLTTVAENGILYTYYEIAQNYSYTAVASNYTASVTVTQAGSVGTPFVLCRSVGLASKAFILNDVRYVLTSYQSPYQNTYFLLDASNSTSAAPKVISKLSYQNGGGYLTVGLPNVTIINDSAYIPYLFKDLIQAVNKNTNVAAGNQTAGVYSQLGISLATFTFNSDNLGSSEIANNLHITGGILWQYDGYLPVEHGFFLYPDSVVVSTATGSGSITAQDYYYQVCYEWSDNQGNLYRSAPSIPVKITTTTASSTNTINVPNLRLTYKISNPVKIVVYRWSTAQQVYYQVTSINSATLNDTTSDFIGISDSLADSTILGNNVLYTTGGVLENICAPATNITTIFDTRLWLLDAENPRTLWFSKPVIQSTPVEMTDLQTIYIAPTSSAQTNTGDIRAMTAMDDKLVLFTRDAIYYINGTGPDITGSNSQYSQPIFISSTVGSINQNSLVLIPNGLMFQSDKGIWLLDRQLGTSYIGSPVEDFNSEVVSAKSIPGTNQVRFSLSDGTVLMYDYFYNQWGTFVSVPNISSCIYNDLHTFINSSGQVYQETPDQYLDGSRPVLISFQTAWYNLAGLQGYERFYYALLLGEYFTPFRLSVSFSYDYKDSTSQTVTVSPDNFAEAYGDEANWGSGPAWGGTSESNVFESRIFPQIQKCESFRITVEESYDRTYDVPAGQGLSLSGLTVIVGVKKGYRVQKASRSFG